MRLKTQFPAVFLGAALMLGQAPGWSQPRADDSGAKQDAKAVGQGTKKVATKTGNGVKKGTQKTVHATKKVFHKTKTTTKGAVDGGKEGAKQ
jgi:hypothetical protein